MLRGPGNLRFPPTDADCPPDERERRLARQGVAAVLIVTACYLLAMAFTRQSDLFAVPRYLFPVAIAAPVLADRILRGGGALGTRLRRLPAPARVALAGAALTALLAWNLAGIVALTPASTAALDHGTWVSNDDSDLLRLLRAHGVHTVISNDYWEGLRLTFESGESLIAIMITPTGHPGFNRYPPYVAQGLADPRPAYLELTGTPEAALHQARLNAGALPGYSVRTVGQFTIILPG
jgi:hypothetical protein